MVGIEMILGCGLTWGSIAHSGSGSDKERAVRPDERGAESLEGAQAAAKRTDIKNLAPHDLRRTCARLCHLAGGELEQIQFLLGHASVQTTERYLGCKQRLSQAVNDKLGLEDT